MRLRKLKAMLGWTAVGLALLFLLHFESVSIGPLKVSHLWKLVLLAYLVVKVLPLRRKVGAEYYPLFWLSALQLFNMEIINNPVNAVISCGTVLLFPLLGIFLLSLSAEKLERLLLFFASFVILSFVPYKFGLLTSMQEGYDLTTFAGGEEIYGLIGPFQKVHSASGALAFSLLVVIFFLAVGRFNRLFLMSLFVAGSYFLFYTYVRTGMLMVLIGAIPIIFHFSKRSISSLVQVVLVGGLAAALVAIWVIPNEVLLNKITGERTYYNEDSFETYGSGRVRFAIAALDYYSEANPLEQVFGIGETEGVNRMFQKIGVELFPHNGFIFLLTANGVVGLLVFLAFLRRALRRAIACESSGKVMAVATLAAYVTFTFFQSYDLIYAFAFVAVALALVMAQGRNVERLKWSEA